MRLLKVVSGQNPREIAFRVLRAGEDGHFAEQVLERELTRTSLTPPDRRLCQELAYGVIRWRATLDWLIARKTGGRTQKPALQDLLRLGLYQIFWLERIPSHAAVHETVEQAKRAGFGPQSGFVNAVLRGYVRENSATRTDLEQLKSTQPHLAFSHPQWLVQRWVARWGQADAIRLMEWNNTAPSNFARVNTLKVEPGALLQQWREHESVDYDFVRKDWLEENAVFQLKSSPSLGSLRSFQTGCFYVQDPSTLLAVRLLEPRPGESILDLCAAPGGKLTAIGQHTRNEGRLVAHDVSDERLALVKQNCSRLGVHCLSITSLADAVGPFDKILLDAPCSNTGVMRRRIGLRWRIRPEEIQRLRTSQLELLTKAAALLRPGGRLIYSTCSIEPEENQDVVREFLGNTPELKLVSERELLPFRDETDGAYVAVLLK